MNDLEKRIIDKIDEMKDDIVEFHQNIVRMPSENPPGKYREISEFVENEFKAIGLETINKRKNIIGL